MVNFVAATHPKGQKRCRRGDACQITSFDVKTLACGRSFCSYLGRAYEVLLEISGGLSHDMRISCDDLISLLSNLLDNALHAAAAAKNRAISLQIQQRGNMLSLSVANSFCAQSEERDWRHGFGNLIVQEIAERYDGWVRREAHDDRYIVQVTLLLEERRDD